MQIRSSSKMGVNHTPKLLAVAILLGGSVAPALAADYQLGEVLIRTSGSATIGTTIRTESVDKKLANQVGNRNFDRNRPTSTALKGFADVDFSYRNYGLFVRGNAWYDYELKKGERRDIGNAPNGFTPNKALSDSGFTSEQKFSGVQLLDAYLYGEWEVADKPVTGRVGRQALAWGESLFLGGGVNIINPYDVGALRRAGSQLKEALLPVGMVSGTLGVTDELSLQAFYQYEWEATRLDQCGTFFSAFDGLQEGCLTMDLGGGYMVNGEFDAPEDGGQYGLAARYYAGSLNTEFGAYYINYHSRNPFIAFNPYYTAYSVIFPEDIEVYGLSAATTLLGKTVYGEIAYRPDQPVMLTGASVPYDTYKNWNFIVGTMFNIPQFMGADELMITAEAGYSRTADIDEGSAVFGNNTRNAYGYRLSMSMPFTNVFMGVNMTPSLGINHDVKGTSANGDFVDGRITSTLGMKFQYMGRYTLDVNYTVNTGGKDSGPGGIKNLSYDRDFLGVAMTVDF